MNTISVGMEFKINLFSAPDVNSFLSAQNRKTKARACTKAKKGKEKMAKATMVKATMAKATMAKAMTAKAMTAKDMEEKERKAGHTDGQLLVVLGQSKHVQSEGFPLPVYRDLVFTTNFLRHECLG